MLAKICLYVYFGFIGNPDVLMYIGWFNLPIRLVWLTGLFRAPGGGEQFATFMLMTIIADVFDEEERCFNSPAVEMYSV